MAPPRPPAPPWSRCTCELSGATPVTLPPKVARLPGQGHRQQRRRTRRRQSEMPSARVQRGAEGAVPRSALRPPPTLHFATPRLLCEKKWQRPSHFRFHFVLPRGGRSLGQFITRFVGRLKSAKRGIVCAPAARGMTMAVNDGETSTPLDAVVRELVLADRVRDASDLILARLSPELRPFLHRLLGDVVLADEAHSATCERLWRGLKTFRWECSLRSWSYIIARREASRCRARHAQANLQQTTLTAAERVPAHTPTRQSLSTTRRDFLDNLRESLSAEDRDLLVLRVERGLAWKEIAAAFWRRRRPTPTLSIGRRRAFVNAIDPSVQGSNLPSPNAV